ncbi:hypothetical protein AURDEDRAFT_177462 [Auricularia subglabra TFB-10046 SS5]|uniref:Uncharacterized protein n=1 Tax=Auricularia subglabra (strain TFB-10046 / SS5) TaxID=717982 RepID=J0LAM8_AURST|nr:hypothetical protein AURDEDRAFT_177462 [Auricularia subglabra TFB-10046 SS5]
MTVDKCTAHCKSKGYRSLGSSGRRSAGATTSWTSPRSATTRATCRARATSQRSVARASALWSTRPATTRRRPRPPFHYYYYYYPQQQNTGVVKPPAPTSQPAKPTYTTQPPLKETTNPTKPAPTTAAVSGFTSLGCFVDSQS